MQQESPLSGDVRLAFLKDFANQLNTREIDLPPFPDAYARILAALDDPELSMDQLAKVITGAPELCVRILLMANSALMNRSGVEVTDLNVAVARLGAAAIRNAAVSLATRELFETSPDSPWYHQLDAIHTAAITTAAVAYAMAARAGLARARDNAMLSGLLHNVGNLYILSKAEAYPQLANREAMENWGPGIGRAIIENWGFPEEIAEAVEYQDVREACQPGPADLRDLLVVSKRRAELRLRQPGDDADFLAEWAQAPAFRKLEVSPLNAELVLEEIAEDVESFLGAIR